MKKNAFIVAAIVIVIVFSFSLSFAGGTVEPLKKAEQPIWKIGHKWTIQITLTNPATGAVEKKSTVEKNVVEVSNDGYLLVVIDENGKKTTAFYNKNTNFVWAKNENGVITESDAPEIPYFSWPLLPGKEWQGTYFFQGSNPLNRSTNILMRSQVVGPKSIIGADGQEIATLEIVSKRYLVGTKSEKPIGESTAWYDPLIDFQRRKVSERAAGKVETQEVLSFTPGL